MNCKPCEKRGQTWPGSPPKCAFQGEFFSADNWNCATMNLLRDAIEDQKVYSGHQLG